MSHPVLPAQPTLSDIQQYVEAALKHRHLTDSTLQDEFIMLVEEVGELAKALRQHTGHKMGTDAASTNVRHEVADVLWMILAICNQLNIDAEQVLREKDAHNITRTWA